MLDIETRFHRLSAILFLFLSFFCSPFKRYHTFGQRFAAVCISMINCCANIPAIVEFNANAPSTPRVLSVQKY